MSSNFTVDAKQHSMCWALEDYYFWVWRNHWPKLTWIDLLKYVKCVDDKYLWVVLFNARKWFVERSKAKIWEDVSRSVEKRRRRIKWIVSLNILDMIINPKI